MRDQGKIEPRDKKRPTDKKPADGKHRDLKDARERFKDKFKERAEGKSKGGKDEGRERSVKSSERPEKGDSLTRLKNIVEQWNKGGARTPDRKDSTDPRPTGDPAKDKSLGTANVHGGLDRQKALSDKKVTAERGATSRPRDVWDKFRETNAKRGNPAENPLHLRDQLLSSGNERGSDAASRAGDQRLAGNGNNETADKSSPANVLGRERRVPGEVVDGSKREAASARSTEQKDGGSDRSTESMDAHGTGEDRLSSDSYMKWWNKQSAADRKIAQTDNNAVLYIRAGASKLGSTESNQSLSERRAQNFATFAREKLGIVARIEIDAMGEDAAHGGPNSDLPADRFVEAFIGQMKDKSEEGETPQKLAEKITENFPKFVPDRFQEQTRDGLKTTYEVTNEARKGNYPKAVWEGGKYLSRNLTNSLRDVAETKKLTMGFLPGAMNELERIATTKNGNRPILDREQAIKGRDWARAEWAKLPEPTKNQIRKNYPALKKAIEREMRRKAGIATDDVRGRPSPQ